MAANLTENRMGSQPSRLQPAEGQGDLACGAGRSSRSPTDLIGRSPKLLTPTALLNTLYLSNFNRPKE